MSIRAMTQVAVQRETTKPRKAKKTKDEEQPATVPQGWTDVLISAIPTEVLAVYTTIVGIIVATITIGDPDRLTLRWILYGAGIAVVVVWLAAGYFRQTTAQTRKRRFPWPETFAAAIAFAAWGLVMPGSPLAESLGEDDRVIWTVIISGAAVLLLAMLGLPIKDKVKE